MKKTANTNPLVCLCFAVLAAICTAMAVATIAEIECGTEFVHTHFYGSWWFVALWFVVAICGSVYYVRRKAYRRMFVTGIHIALLVILAGAAITHFTSRQGFIHLREGMAAETFTADDDECTVLRLPFKITLLKFETIYYEATNVPSDYRSAIEVTTPNGASQTASISMNKIYKSSGIRLYQASFDEDMHGSTLLVNCDPVGIPVTYTGYFMLFASFIGWLFSRGGMMRKALRSKATMLAAFFVSLSLATAHDAKAETVIPQKQAAKISKLLMNYEGRIAPVKTFANDFTRKITDGKTSYNGFSAEQVITGWMLFPGEWEQKDIISIKSRKLRDFLGLQRHTSYSSIAAALSQYTPEDIEHVAGRKETLRLSEKLDLIYSLERGALLKMFPVQNGGTTRWYAPCDSLPQGLKQTDADLIRMSFANIYGCMLMQKPELIDTFAKEISNFQQKNGGTSLPSQLQLDCENILNKIPFTDILFKINLIAGVVALFMCIRKSEKAARVASLAVSASTAAALLFVVALRAIVAQHVPLSNGYETMLALALLLQVVSIIMRRGAILNSLALIGAGFVLLVASLQNADPKISPLMPVLSSPLLGIHVSVIMTAYAFLTLTFIMSLAALLADAAKSHSTAMNLTNATRTVLPLAIATLGTGIFVGAIWANVSWGSYWSWDSKETWSLITFIAYAFALHEGSFRRLKQQRFFNTYIVLVYATVLMTYFGVNIILPGMHSYSGM